MVADDRGQLLLFGGITVAVVFLVTIALTNSLIVTQNVATPDNADRIEQVADREAAVERDLQAIVTRTRAANDTDEFADALNRSLANYSTYQTRVSGARTGAYVDVTLNESGSVGEKLAGSDFRDPDGGGSDWTLATDSSQISRFNITVTDADKMSPGGSAAFKVNISESPSGAVWKLRVYEPTSLGGPMQIEVDNGSGWTHVCTGSAPIKIDIKKGTCTVSGSPKPFPENYTETVDRPYEVRFEKPNRADGRYQLVATGITKSSATSYPAVPAIDVTYTNYERTILINETS